MGSSKKKKKKKGNRASETQSQLNTIKSVTITWNESRCIGAVCRMMIYSHGCNEFEPSSLARHSEESWSCHSNLTVDWAETRLNNSGHDPLARTHSELRSLEEFADEDCRLIGG
jgi:hypothetical protein